MESDDLLVTLGLSSYGFDLRQNWVGGRKFRINAKNGNIRIKNGRFLRI